ncbi:hypothetical protein IKF63_02020 [Candidatus Saccharibacteria bacterium]|nr:hypothetical protein [Candidatus Saccharibacteria bacterium]
MGKGIAKIIKLKLGGQRLLGDAADGEAVQPIVAVRGIQFSTVHVQVVTVASRGSRARPPVPVAADVVHSTIVDVPKPRKLSSPHEE